MAARPLELITEDGVVLRGVWGGDGQAWAVILHDVGDDLDSMATVTRSLERAGLAVLAPDLRGHGASDGRWSGRADGVRDVRAAVRAARDAGAQDVFVVALGETAALTLEAGLDDVQALALIAPGAVAAPLDDAARRRTTCPKLLLVGGRCTTGQAAVAALERALIGPRLTVSVPTHASGAGLVNGRCRAQVLDHLVTFLASARRSPRPAHPTAA